jgi:hypothetical protein
MYYGQVIGLDRIMGYKPRAVLYSHQAQPIK